VRLQGAGWRKGLRLRRNAVLTQSDGQEYTLQEVIMRVLEKVSGAGIYGVKSGHVSGMKITLPYRSRRPLIADATAIFFADYGNRDFAVGAQPKTRPLHHRRPRDTEEKR